MKNIKDVYKEVENEKENKVESKDVITMSKSDFIEEHKNLIAILRSGDRKKQEAEAKKQEAELAEEVGETEEDNEDNE